MVQYTITRQYGRDVILEEDPWTCDLVDHLLQSFPASKYVLLSTDGEDPSYQSGIHDAFVTSAGDTSPAPEFLTRTIPSAGQLDDDDALSIDISTWMASHECFSDTVIIALGDLTVAHLVSKIVEHHKDSLQYVAVPTTFSAMIGVGASREETIRSRRYFRHLQQPTCVYHVSHFLDNASRRDILNGLVGAIGIAAFWDKGLFSALEQHADMVTELLSGTSPSEDRDMSGISHLMRTIRGPCINWTAGIPTFVGNSDDSGYPLDFGQSIGLAIQAAYSTKDLHPECMAIGMVKEAELARYLDILPSDACARLVRCIASYGLPTSLDCTELADYAATTRWPIDGLINNMPKGSESDSRKLIFPSAIGTPAAAKVSNISEKDIQMFFADRVTVYPGSNRNLDFAWKVPGSADNAYRILLMATLGRGRCRVCNMPRSEETDEFLNALEALTSVERTWEDDGSTLVLEGRKGVVRTPPNLYLTAPETTLSPLLLLASLSQSSSTAMFRGGRHSQESRHGPLLDALRKHGCIIDCLDKAEYLPLRFDANGGLQGGEIRLAGNVSARDISSILMCAPYAHDPVTLHVDPVNEVTQGFIHDTMNAMTEFGVRVERSEMHPNIFHIPKQPYTNPQSYDLESDSTLFSGIAAMAALTGSKCTKQNGGLQSNHHDNFIIDILKPIGCEVQQASTQNTVVGPPQGQLSSLANISVKRNSRDFLIATALAVAIMIIRGRSEVHVDGLSSLGKKGRVRIDTLEKGLIQHGLHCSRLSDSLHIGYDGNGLKRIEDGIDCLGDQLVAMAFSIIALVAKEPTALLKAPTKNLWPQSWERILHIFGVTSHGSKLQRVPDLGTTSHKLLSPSKSIYIIGMRGTGKTTVGGWSSHLLSWPFLDLDVELERTTGMSIPNLISTRGWSGFRLAEMTLLARMMQEKPTGYIFATGGGVVETEEARDLFIKHRDQGGKVLFLSRDIQKVLGFLGEDKTRPALVDDALMTWLRRKPLYDACCSHRFEMPTIEAGTGGMDEAMLGLGDMLKAMTMSALV